MAEINDAAAVAAEYTSELGLQAREGAYADAEGVLPGTSVADRVPQFDGPLYATRRDAVFVARR